MKCLFGGTDFCFVAPLPKTGLMATFGERDIYLWTKAYWGGDDFENSQGCLSIPISFETKEPRRNDIHANATL